MHLQRTGCPFHPTGLYPVGVLISEAILGEGSTSLTAKEGGLWKIYWFTHSRIELARRYITSRAINCKILAGQEVYPDSSFGLPCCWEQASILTCRSGRNLWTHAGPSHGSLLHGRDSRKYSMPCTLEWNSINQRVLYGWRMCLCPINWDTPSR